MGLGLGKEQEGQRGDRAEGRQQVVGKVEEVVQMCEEPPWRNWVTASESQIAIMDMMLGGVTTSCVMESKCPLSHDCKRAAAGRERSNEWK